MADFVINYMQNENGWHGKVIHNIDNLYPYVCTIYLLYFILNRDKKTTTTSNGFRIEYVYWLCRKGDARTHFIVLIYWSIYEIDCVSRVTHKQFVCFVVKKEKWKESNIAAISSKRLSSLVWRT